MENTNNPAPEGSTPHHYKEDWSVEDAITIKHLEDELAYFTDRLQRHCFNPPMYTKLSELAENLKKLIDKEKKEYEQSYGQAYNRPSS